MTVMHAMLGNAAVAAVLALLALAVGRTCRSPALRHVAWVLVLLKLVTPPLFSVPLPVLPASWNAPPAGPASPGTRVTQAPPAANTANASPGGTVSGPAWWERFRPEGAAQWALAAWALGAA